VATFNKNGFVLVAAGVIIAVSPFTIVVPPEKLTMEYVVGAKLIKALKIEYP
jgi:hypothetical protein